MADTGDFVNADLDNTFNNQRIRSKVYESYKRFADGRKGIIYAINKLHASKIAELYCSHGINAVAIDCDTPKEERQELISKFKTGEITVLVNVEIFTEGFDCPDVSFIQLARPTKSLALYLQQVGRGLRIVEGKEKTIIIDNVGLYNYFGLPDANRKWQYHFKGHDDVEHSSSRGTDTFALRDEDHEFDENRLAEEDKEMMIVRGASDKSLKTSNCANQATAALPIEEISLCDYYLIRGNAEKFKVYPLIKKKGKTTGAVGSCIYEYNAEERPVTFTLDVKENMIWMDGDTKLRTLIAFSAMLLNKTITEILDLDNLCCISQSDYVTEAGLFEVLKMMSKIQS